MEADKAANISDQSIELIRSHMEASVTNDMHSMFECIAVCHSGKVDNDRDFLCSSEDERALLHAARKVGYSFVSRKNNVVRVKIHRHLHQYSVAAILPFDSTRKMMSVVCCTPDNEYVIFTKGADTSIFPRLASDRYELETLRMRSSQFASEGLRTIVCAMRVFDEETKERFDAFRDHS